MATNPLQKYFRQPKIFIKLPSGGIFSKPGTIQGDITHMPVYGMTGMDEIIIKTPMHCCQAKAQLLSLPAVVPTSKTRGNCPILILQ